MHNEPLQAMQLSLNLVEPEEEPPSRGGLNLFSIVQAAPTTPLADHPAEMPPRRRSLRMNSRCRSFRNLFFPDATDEQWSDWRWQIRNRIRDLETVRRMIRLSPEEEQALSLAGDLLPMAVTPHYMGLVSPMDPGQAIRRAVIPTVNEIRRCPGESDDPLGEDHQSPVPGLVHRYPDRVLLLATDFCSTYCRYCTRSRVVGHGEISPDPERLQKIFAYIRKTPQIRDVLVSGGDPLTMDDDHLEYILCNLRAIPHVEIIRIGTKVPAVLPQRVTPQLVKMLRKYHPLWMSLHFTHPDECCLETAKACAMLADAGIPLGSQTVLLKGVNDNAETMTGLVHGMMKMRVKPYYLYQCDPISDSEHFRTPVAKGVDIIRQMRGFTTGYAIPTYVIDAPGGGGKIPISPDYVQERDAAGDLHLRNYEGKSFQYPDYAAN